MRYQVPQFIEIEDKVVGPFTIKQFIYIVGGLGLSFILYRFLPIYISIVIIVFVEALSLSLAFYKINNKPFIDFLESAFLYYSKDNLYIWKKEDRKIIASSVTNQKDPNQVYVPKLSESKLKDLSWTLGVSGNQNPVNEQEKIGN